MSSSSPEERQAVLDAWMAWGTKAGESLVDWGAPTQPTNDDDPGPAGWIGGYSVLQTEDADSLRAILDGHPHTQVGTIEALEILDMPGS